MLYDLFKIIIKLKKVLTFVNLYKIKHHAVYKDMHVCSVCQKLIHYA